MASATANDVITRALRRIKVLAGEEAATGAEGADALTALNAMLHGFGPRGIGYAHSDLAATDTLNVPDEQVRNVTLLLARDLAMDYGYPLDPDMKIEILRAEQELQAAYTVVPPASTDRGILRRRTGYPFNIVRGDE